MECDKGSSVGSDLNSDVVANTRRRKHEYNPFKEFCALGKKNKKHKVGKAVSNVKKEGGVEEPGSEVVNLVKAEQATPTVPPAFHDNLKFMEVREDTKEADFLWGTFARRLEKGAEVEEANREYASKSGKIVQDISARTHQCLCCGCYMRWLQVHNLKAHCHSQHQKEFKKAMEYFTHMKKGDGEKKHAAGRTALGTTHEQLKGNEKLRADLEFTKLIASENLRHDLGESKALRTWINSFHGNKHGNTEYKPPGAKTVVKYLAVLENESQT